MAATVMDGKALAARVRAEVAVQVEALGAPVGLATVLVGGDPASAIYVRRKHEACQEVGIEAFDHHLPAETSEADLLALVARLNADPRVNGILVQLPLPDHIDEGRVLRAVREDEVAVASLGKNAQRFRLQSFVLGSTLMGLAGALYASFVGFVSPFDFLPILTFQVWAMLIVGGSGNNRGAMIGALIVWAIWAFSGVAVSKWVPPTHAAQGAAIQVILIGLALVFMLLFRPRGLIGERAIVSRHIVW